ncbi:MAG: DUF3526 domain-containing protein [Desulfurivibrionaceae bacterium]
MKIRDAFLAAIHTEFRLIRAETAPKLVIFLTIGALTYGLIGGVAFRDTRNNSSIALKESSMTKFQANREIAQAMAEGKEPMPDKPYRDPGNTIWVGGSTPEIAEFPQSPLSFLAVGESDLYPAAIPVTAKGKDSFLFNDEINNPTHLLTGVFDPAFAVVFLLPLFILALTYNIISGEREQGTLSLNAASPVPMRVIMSAKLLVRVAVPVFTAVAVLMAAVYCLQPTALASASILAVALVVYGMFWGAAALAINGFGLDSTGNALIMSILWISSAFILPAMIDAAVELRHPAPARSAVVLAVRNSTVKGDSAQDAAQSQYDLEHAGTDYTHGDSTTVHTHYDPTMIRGTTEDKNYRQLQSIKNSQAVGDSIYQEQQHILAQRKALADKLRFLSPVMVMQDIFSETAGNGMVRYGSYMEQVDRFHDSWRTFFVALAEQGIRLDASLYDDFPKFRYEDNSRSETNHRIAAGILAISFFFIGSAAAAKLLLNRFRVAGR